MTALMCAAEANAADMCKVLVAAEAGSVRKDGKTALILAAVADARDAALVLAVRRRQASATQMALLLRGLPAQRHRSASLTEEEPHPERHRSSTSRRPRSAVLVATLCPYEKELQQPVESCPYDRRGPQQPCAVLSRRT